MHHDFIGKLDAHQMMASMSLLSPWLLAALLAQALGARDEVIRSRWQAAIMAIFGLLFLYRLQLGFDLRQLFSQGGIFLSQSRHFLPQGDQFFVLCHTEILAHALRLRKLDSIPLLNSYRDDSCFW